jgi:ribosomal protein S18 acetylase RimI-like enzyme
MIARRTAWRARRSIVGQAADGLGYAAVMSGGQTSLLIRPARPEEYEALGELLVAAFRSLPLMPGDEEYVRELGDIRARAEEACQLVAATPAGGLLGGVTYVPGPESRYSQQLAAGEAGIRMLGVDPARHDRGVGRALTEACIGRARSDGRTRVRLYTGTWMLAAQHLYEQLGFRRVPERDYPQYGMLAYALELGHEGSADGRRVESSPR